MAPSGKGNASLPFPAFSRYVRAAFSQPFSSAFIWRKGIPSFSASFDLPRSSKSHKTRGASLSFVAWLAPIISVGSPWSFLHRIRPSDRRREGEGTPFLLFSLSSIPSLGGRREEGQWRGMGRTKSGHQLNWPKSLVACASQKGRGGWRLSVWQEGLRLQFVLARCRRRLHLHPPPPLRRRHGALLSANAPSAIILHARMKKTNVLGEGKEKGEDRSLVPGEESSVSTRNSSHHEGFAAE